MVSQKHGGSARLALIGASWLAICEEQLKRYVFKYLSRP